MALGALGVGGRNDGVDALGQPAQVDHRVDVVDPRVLEQAPSRLLRVVAPLVLGEGFRRAEELPGKDVQLPLDLDKTHVPYRAAPDQLLGL